MAPIARHNPQGVLEDIAQQFTLGDEQLLSITQQFLDDFALGLGDYGNAMAMIPTFVTGVPDGTETGTFLALDLGGTNLRVCEVQLHGDQTFNLRQQKYKVSTALKTGEASALFDYLADSVDAFLTESGYEFPDADDTPVAAVPLGFTFSFPVEQTALDSGTLLTWTKGFGARNAVGNDVVKLLQDAFNRKHLHVRCVALVNDTVGALLSRAYTAGGCVLGAIFGTGTNGAYLERVANITKLKNAPAAAQGGDMIINTEWGAFNNSRSQLPTTVFDNVLDRQSINPHFQAFEKFISGMYLGEITRNVLLSLVDAAPRPILFSGQSSKELNEHYGLDTAVMSAVEEAWEGKKDDSEEIKKEEVEVKKEHGDLPPDNATALSGTSKTDGSSQAPLTPTPAPSGVTTTASASTTALKSANKLPPTLSVPELFEDDVKNTLDHLDKSILTRLERVRQVIISQLHIKSEYVSLRDAAVVRFVVGLVSTRAAALSACAVATVAVQTGAAKLGKSANKGSGERQKFAVGVDGSLIQFYPNFEVHLRESLRVLVGEEVERSVEIGMAKDGSGVGAALCALQAMKQLKK